MQTEIRNANGHYEVFIDGKFIGSEDTEPEAYKMLQEEENKMN